MLENPQLPVTVLGATGSIGCSTLDVISRHPQRFSVYALTAHRQIEKLEALCLAHNPKIAVVDTAVDAVALGRALLQQGCRTRVEHGSKALQDVCRAEVVDTVVTGIVGAAGLLPTVAAVDAGKRVLIANKEPLVMMGHAIVSRAIQSGARLIPLDSEHNAIFQCLPGDYRVGAPDGLKGVSRLLLTASGGPFRQWSREALESVTPEQAIAHPNWSMGPKISVDSATLMNKGLELIEACVLFSIQPRDVRVVIHPQSTIHSMVEYEDGSVLAQMGSPDMRVPIAHGLGWPDRIESGAARLDMFEVARLDFEKPDTGRFPCLRLAREAAETGGITPVALSAANEVAVQAFLETKINFTRIPVVIEETLARVDATKGGSLDAVLAVDEEARRYALESIRT